MTFKDFAQKTWIRRALWTVAGVGLLWVIAWLAVPPLLKSQMELRGTEALGRKLTLGAVNFRPWSLELTLSDVAIATQDGSSQQLTIDRIYVDAEMESILRLAPVIDAMEVDAPRLRITHQGEGQYDFDDIVQRLTADDGKPPSTPPRFALYNVVLRDGSVDYVDHSDKLERTHTVRGLHLSLPFLSNLDSKRDIKVMPRLAFNLNGSAFDSAAEGTLFAQTRKADATLKVTHLDLAPYLSYLPKSLPVQIAGAVVDADIRLSFEQTQSPHVALSGSLNVADLWVRDSAGGEMLSVGSVRTVLADVRPLERVVKLASVEIQSPKLKVARNRAGRLNVDPGAGKKVPVAPKKEATSSDSTGASAPWSFELIRFALHQGDMTWVDDAVQPQARVALADLELAAANVQWPFASSATVEGSANVPVRGKPARFEFKAEGTDQQAKLSATLMDLSLGLGAPYAAQFLEPALQGRLDADLEATWQDAQLRVDIHRLGLKDFALQSRSKLVATNAAERAAQEMPRFKLLEIRDTQVDLAARSVRVGKVALLSPSVMLQRDAQGVWMAQRGLKTVPVAAAGDGAATPAAIPAASPAPRAEVPWKVTLADVALTDGTVSLDDRSLARPVRVEVFKLQVAAQKLALDGKGPAPVTVSARVRSGRAEAGSLAYKGTVMWDPLAVQGSVQAVDIPAHAFAPYAVDRLNVDLQRADTSFKGNFRFASTAAGTELQVQGDAALEDFRANTLAAGTGEADIRAAEELLNWKSLNVPGIDLTMAPGKPMRLQVREAALSDFYARVIVSPQGRLNLQDLAKPAPIAAPSPAPSVPSAPASAAVPAVAAAPATGPDPIIQVGPISLVNGRVLFSDRFIQPNYSTDLSELTGRLSQFSSQARDGAVQMADLDLRGRAEGTASLEITGKLNPLAKPLALDIRGRVRDLELSPLSPYAIKYSGYGITRGKLSVDVNYKIQPDGQLTANNNIVLNQLIFGDKVDGAPNSLPVKLAVALLADRNGVIDINLPVSGSLNDPQFSLGPVVWKVLTNLIVKAITSPFSLLGGALGGGGDELSAVNFEPGSSVVSAEAQQSLDKVVKALVDRPALKMTVTGTASLEVERDAIKRERLKGLLLAEKRRRALNEGQDAAAVTAVAAAEFPALLKGVYRRSDITKPRNLVGMIKDIPDADMEKLLLANIAVTEESARELALQRGVGVKEYLASRKLPAERLFLGAIKSIKKDADWKPRADLSLTND
jgi:hypothetical protein